MITSILYLAYFKFSTYLPVFFAEAGDSCNPRNGSNNAGGFFGLPHWWKYLDSGQRDGYGNCTPSFNATNLNDLWGIGLAVLEILLRIAGIAAVVYIVVAGFYYVSSAGDTNKAQAARTRIVNAVVGLVIVIIATASVNFIGNALGG